MTATNNVFETFKETLNKFNKVYYAVVEGNVKEEERLEDKLLKDNKRNICWKWRTKNLLRNIPKTRF